MAKAPASHRSPWLKKELTEIKRSIKQGLSVKDISKSLGRSEAAIRARSSIEGISLRKRA